MEVIDPARRLLDLLNRIERTWAANSGQKGWVGVRRCFTDMQAELGLADSDASFMRFLADLSEAPGDIRRALEAISAHELDDWASAELAHLEAALGATFVQRNLDQHRSDWLNGRMQLALSSMSSTLRNRASLVERPVPDGALVELVRLVQEARTKVVGVGAAIHPDFAKALLGALFRIEQAVEDYRVRGIDALHEALDQLTGTVLTRLVTQDSETSDATSAVWRAVRGLVQVVHFGASIATIALAVGVPWYDIEAPAALLEQLPEPPAELTSGGPFGELPPAPPAAEGVEP